MNENIDLVKILDGCPLGTKLYSPLFGEVTLAGVNTDGFIGVYTRTFNPEVFESDGKYRVDNSTYAECLIFPSKYQQDWNKFVRFWDKTKVEKFDPKTLQPFDKVLVRDESSYAWEPDMFGYTYCKRLVSCINGRRKQCIPYNEETKHLIGTNEDCPDYYNWWEE